MVSPPPSRLAAVATVAALAATSLFALPGTALAEPEDALGLDYVCSSDTGSSARLDLERVPDPGPLPSEEALLLQVRGNAERLGFTETGDGERVESVSVSMDMWAGEQRIELEDEDADSSSLLLEAEFTPEAAGRIELLPGDLTVIRTVVAAEDEEEENGARSAGEETGREKDGRKDTEAGADEEGEKDEEGPAPTAAVQEEDEGSPAEGGEADQEDEEDEEAPAEGETQRIECSLEDPDLVFGEFEVVDGPAETPAPDPVVSATGVAWEGVWVCSSDREDLMPAFEGPGEVRLVLSPAQVREGEEVHLVAESVSFTGMPSRGQEIEAGALSATLEALLGGDAAPREKVEISSVNSEPVGAEDAAITFAEPEPLVLFPEGGDKFAVELGDLVLRTELADGTVTHTCAADGEPLDPADIRPSPALGEEDRNALPITGPALLGLIGAALAALLSGGGAMALARQRSSAVDDEL